MTILDERSYFIKNLNTQGNSWENVEFCNEQNGTRYACVTLVSNLIRVSICFTCSEGQNDGHPACDVGPGEAPVHEPLAEERDRHTSVNSQGQQRQEPCGVRKQTAAHFNKQPTQCMKVCHRLTTQPPRAFPLFRV